jgi:hypothetical protein
VASRSGLSSARTGWRAGEARELNFTPMGGAYNRVPAEATAFVHRDELFLIEYAVSVDCEASATQRATARDWLARSSSSLREWGSGRVYQTRA